MSTRSATAKATRPAHVAFVGAGPGDPALLTVAATELLARADTIVIDHLAREDIVERFARPDVTVVDAGTDSLSHGDHGRPLTHAAKAKLAGDRIQPLPQPRQGRVVLALNRQVGDQHHREMTVQNRHLRVVDIAAGVEQNPGQGGDDTGAVPADGGDREIQNFDPISSVGVVPTATTPGPA